MRGAVILTPSGEPLTVTLQCPPRKEPIADDGVGCRGEYSQEDPGSAEDSVKTSTELEIPAPQEPRSPSAKAFLAKKGQSLFFFFFQQMILLS